MKTIFTVFLLSFACCAQHFRLNTNENTTLKAGQWLISTLGYFKAHLVKEGCILVIQMFNESSQSYSDRGFFESPFFTGSCESLTVTTGQVVTDGSQNYWGVQTESYNASTILTIDDQGVIRLIGSFYLLNLIDTVSKEVAYDAYRTLPPYIRSFSQLIVNFEDRFSTVSNQRNWKFQAGFGELKITSEKNPVLSTNYVYSSITLRDSRIFDFTNQTLPGILYNNLTLQPRCTGPRVYFDFKPPFTFAIDPFWPILRVYEQGGYQIMQVAYGNLPQYDYRQNITQIHYYHSYSPCPARTFEHKGDCIAKCPAPYFHDMRGQSGFCVLNCEQFSQIDHTQRICSCVTTYEYPKLNRQFIRKCPTDSQATPYGCSCSTGFYDSLLTFTCVAECPNATFGSMGLCMQCPHQCFKCNIDNQHRRYLSCTQCEPGYKLQFGQCVKSCVSTHAYSIIEGKCQKCIDENCVDCSDDPKTCLRCNVITTLRHGSCLDSCGTGEYAVYAGQFNTKCISPADQSCSRLVASNHGTHGFLKCQKCTRGYAYLDRCVLQCPVGYQHVEKYCLCSDNKLTVYDKCLDIAACPLSMSFDLASRSCLSCPFGCTSCISQHCTSCSPGYFLYLSPQRVLCRKKSPIFACDGLYSWQHDSVCLVKSYLSAALKMTECQKNMRNCKICLPKSESICVLCREGFYLYNNTCSAQCPPGLIVYQNACLLTEIEQCSVPHLQSRTSSAIVTIDAIEASQSYKHYIYDGLEPGNDPVGFIPYFKKLTTMKSDGIPRSTKLSQPSWICLKCSSGYGLSDDFKKCIPCPQSCSTCYMAKDESCLERRGCKFYYDPEAGTCLNSCSDPNKYPEIQQGQLVCNPFDKSVAKNYIRIDSAIYSQGDGTQIVIFGFSEKLQAIDGGGDSDIQQISVTKVNELRLTADLGQPAASGIQAINFVSAPLVNGEYVSLDGQAAELYLLNLSTQVGKLQGQFSGSSIPNLLYGAEQMRRGGSSEAIFGNHQSFRQRWLAYIGYFLSITILLLHAVFVGNLLLYKVDNLLIFAQSIFYFSYAKNLIGKLLAQFYFGWSFSHARFLPNLFGALIPDHYQESACPLSYKIMQLDGNYFRNAGFSLAWALLFTTTWVAVTLAVFAIGAFKKNRQIWHPNVAKQALYAAFEFFTINLMFYSYSQLNYSGRADSDHQGFYTASQAFAIMTITGVGLYSLFRFYMNRVAGILMLKRMAIPAALFASYENQVFMVPVILLEVLFMIARYLFERPEGRWATIFVAAEGFGFAGCYALMFAVTDMAAITIIVTLVVFAFIIYLAYDLTIVYLESKGEYLWQEIGKISCQDNQKTEISNLMNASKTSVIQLSPAVL